MLTENEVARAWRQLFHRDVKLSEESFQRAELLLDELRPESPLRHRLQGELDELRQMNTAAVSVAERRPKAKSRTPKKKALGS